MKIKTIRFRLDAAEKFDIEVNTALAEGWHLVKREVLPGGPLTADAFEHRMLYAELILPDPPAEPAPPTKSEILNYARAIHLECRNHHHCYECPLDDICDCTNPDTWEFD